MFNAMNIGGNGIQTILDQEEANFSTTEPFDITSFLSDLIVEILYKTKSILTGPNHDTKDFSTPANRDYNAVLSSREGFLFNLIVVVLSRIRRF